MKKIIILLLLACSLFSCAQKPADKNLGGEEVEVVVHRGDWRHYAENSLEGIQSTIDMGADMVEIDLGLTKDSVLILMHDKTIDRATNGKGKPSDFTLEEIKALRLKNGLSMATEYRVPTLEEALNLTKGKIRVNLDKADKYFDLVYDILIKTGTIDDVVIKSTKSYDDLLQKYGENLTKMEFMSVIKIKNNTTFEELKPLLDKRLSMYELVFETENREVLLAVKDELEGTGSRIWINAMWASLCGGYSDDRSVDAPDANWGYLIDTLGATVIQTDRPMQLIEYLQSRGQHK